MAFKIDAAQTAENIVNYVGGAENVTNVAHCMNYMKKSYGMNRQAYRVLSGTFATHVSKDVRRAISEKTFAIQNEIAAYLEDSDELAPQKIKDQAASKYLEGKRS